MALFACKVGGAETVDYVGEGHKLTDVPASSGATKTVNRDYSVIVVSTSWMRGGQVGAGGIPTLNGTNGTLLSSGSSTSGSEYYGSTVYALYNVKNGDTIGLTGTIVGSGMARHWIGFD